ncbi:MAG: ribonuclease E inhibitor RraB [Pseudomonadota bacterium]|jgi:regulator of RNase E activity RraB|uniref:Regulator of ribonuclease activity B domain-containing protein n=1 Tax=hydrothermal vent metagenome TaxID=652676 RepID=A0A160TI92_9ZZZZ
MTLPEVDQTRFEQEWLGDQDVLASLAKNGDRPEIPRMVDISFSGDEEALDRLAENAGELGFAVIDREENEEGGISLFLAREQKADAASIKALTLQCLQIEILYDVEYEGWGCMAETGSSH